MGHLENYRLLSMTFVLGKLVESTVKDKITNHIEEQAVLKQSQDGFCKGKIFSLSC